MMLCANDFRRGVKSKKAGVVPVAQTNLMMLSAKDYRCGVKSSLQLIR